MACPIGSWFGCLSCRSRKNTVKLDIIDGVGEEHTPTEEGVVKTDEVPKEEEKLQDDQNDVDQRNKENHPGGDAAGENANESAPHDDAVDIETQPNPPDSALWTLLDKCQEIWENDASLNYTDIIDSMSKVIPECEIAFGQRLFEFLMPTRHREIRLLFARDTSHFFDEVFKEEPDVIVSLGGPQLQGNPSTETLCVSKSVYEKLPAAYVAAISVSDGVKSIDLAHVCVPLVNKGPLKRSAADVARILGTSKDPTIMFLRPDKVPSFNDSIFALFIGSAPWKENGDSPLCAHLASCLWAYRDKSITTPTEVMNRLAWPYVMPYKPYKCLSELSCYDPYHAMLRKVLDSDDFAVQWADSEEIRRAKELQHQKQLEQQEAAEDAEKAKIPMRKAQPSSSASFIEDVLAQIHEAELLEAMMKTELEQEAQLDHVMAEKLQQEELEVQDVAEAARQSTAQRCPNEAFLAQLEQDGLQKSGGEAKPDAEAETLHEDNHSFSVDSTQSSLSVDATQSSLDATQESDTVLSYDDDYNDETVAEIDGDSLADAVSELVTAFENNVVSELSYEDADIFSEPLTAIELLCADVSDALIVDGV